MSSLWSLQCPLNATTEHIWSVSCHSLEEALALKMALNIIAWSPENDRSPLCAVLVACHACRLSWEQVYTHKKIPPQGQVSLDEGWVMVRYSRRHKPLPFLCCTSVTRLFYLFVFEEALHMIFFSCAYQNVAVKKRVSFRLLLQT